MRGSGIAASASDGVGAGLEAARVGRSGSHGDDMALGALLGRYRRAAGLTQERLALLAGISVGALRDLEQGRTRQPRPGSAARLAQALGLDQSRARKLVQAAQAMSALWGGRDGPSRLPLAANGARVWVQVLGPLAAWRSGQVVELGAPKQRAILGLLALRANRLVHREAVIDAVWGQDPPATAVNLVQSYASRLRRALNTTSAPGGEGGPLVTVGTSYRLRLGTDQMDLLQFDELVARARSTSEAAAAGALYEWAFELWQGEPLADVDTLRGHPAVVELSRRWATAVTEYAETAIGAGMGERVIGHLRMLVGREPFNERAHALLMLALAGGGQQASALHLYQNLRERLDDQLGVRPGPEVADAHLRVLRQQVPVSGRRIPVTTSAPLVPRQLPPGVRHFAGRGDELRWLNGLLDQAARAGGVAVISAIGGTAGIGKTALAVHWARRVADRFPDGQFYVNLRGFDPSATPLNPEEAIRGFLDALGVPPQRIPAGLQAQVGLYRSLLAERCMLVLLDNAYDEQQVRPLLPVSPTCLGLVTSRSQLTGLIATEGAHSLTLDLLGEADAHELLVQRLGAEAVAAEPRAAFELITLCARLPLALSIAAARAATQPGLTLGTLAAELRQARANGRSSVLDLLDGGEPASSVRAVLSWSYQQLGGPAARLFRLLGLYPGADLTVAASASLAGLPLDRASRLLGELTRPHLLAEQDRGRYTLHDLLRAYAVELARAGEGKGERRGALRGLFDYYLAAAVAAMDVLVPAEQHRRPSPPPAGVPLPTVETPQAAREWLDAERANLVAFTGHAAAHGWPAHATRLAATVFRYLDNGAHYPEALAIHTHAVQAARDSGDRAAQAEALGGLASVDFRQGRVHQAADHLHQALALHPGLGNRLGEARTRANLGLIEGRLGRYQQAAGQFHLALAGFRTVGDRFGEARAYSNLGLVEWRQGHYREAARHYRQALAGFRQVGDPDGEACALINLGLVEWRQGRLTQAAGHQQQALARSRQLGARRVQAEALATSAWSTSSRATSSGPPTTTGKPWRCTASSGPAVTRPRRWTTSARSTDCKDGTGGPLTATGRPWRCTTSPATCPARRRPPTASVRPCATPAGPSWPAPGTPRRSPSPARSATAISRPGPTTAWPAPGMPAATRTRRAATGGRRYGCTRRSACPTPNASTPASSTST
jgi:DNA-binding SARP family transcriptional activator/tetratricopeptide (TPR) repeat protein/DNA-binding XRE family transcriptional regulator